MSKIMIMTDSASDISTELEKQYDIEILPIAMELDGKSYASRIDVDNEGFYALMAKSNEIPKTSQITPFGFQKEYHRAAQAGVTDLIVVTLNRKGSQTFANAEMAVEAFFDEHPKYKGVMRITIIDGMGYNAFYGAPVVEACKMRNEGKSADEIIAYLKDIMPRRQLYFGIYDLKYAGKSGRIPTAAAFLGNTFNIKPVMKIADNQITTAAKTRGERNLVSKVVEMSVAEMAPGTAYEVVYGNDVTCCEEVTRLMTEKVGYGPAYAYQIGAAVAANAGPKVCGVCFIKKSM